MMRKSALCKWGTSGEVRLIFWCEGCKTHHPITVSGGTPMWAFNDNLDQPTLAPSVLTTHRSTEPKVCHLYVTNGNIHYLPDCTHELAGQTMPLQEIEEDDWRERV